MKLFFAFVLSLYLLPITVSAEPLQCEIGPVNKVFGFELWTVYACSDNESIVAVTASQNPASPFVFFIGRQEDGSLGVSGEGTGDKEASKAAYEDLIKLQKIDIEKIIIEAKEM